MKRTDRLAGILLELQARGGLRAEDLAQRFEVSVRTMYRDLDALGQGGVPLVGTPGKGYRLQDGYLLPPLTFTPTEAAVLALGGEFMRECVDVQLRQAAADALRKVAAILPTDSRAAVARWRRELSLPSLRRRDDPHLPRLRAAIQQRRVVRLLYRAARREGPEIRDVEPVGLVYLADHWHLTGFCRLRQSPRLFRVDRIDHLNLLGEYFTLEDRHLLESPNEDWKRTADEAHVRFDPAVERWVRERPPFTFLREEVDADGPVFVYAIRDQLELVRWLLSWGSSVEVLSPPAVRAQLAAEAESIARRHVSS